MAGDVKFTPAQQKAINTRNKTLLVSAGAGSGKTTVLTRRILERIREGVNINDILVVTFTNAAAASMKDKLYNTLLEELAKNPSDRKLVYTIYNLPSAKISTIHSFCLDLISTNFAALSLPPAMRVADAAESQILLDTCLEDLIDKSFENDDKGFLTLCDAFAGEKNLDGLKSIATSIYKKFRAFPYWKNCISKAVEEEEAQLEGAGEKGVFATSSGSLMLEMMRERVDTFRRHANNFYTTLSAVATKEKSFNCLNSIADNLQKLDLALGRENPSYNEIREVLTEFKFETLFKSDLPEPVSKEYENLRDGVKNEISSYVKYLAKEHDEVVSDYRRVNELNKLMNSFIIALDDAYAAAKKARGILDFSDLEQFTLELLGQPTPGGIVRTDLCRGLRQSLSEIYIDEYQDINPLQDTIFRLLSREDNLFMVGDVKQSIYRFRNARADIFLGYLKDFPILEESDKKAKIFLPENHRSQKYILDFVNLLFDNLYTNENMNASYAQERLVYPEGKKDENPYPVWVNLFEDGESPAEDEAEFVARTINRLVNEGEGGKRYEYGDIAVILRAVSTSGREFERAFIRHSIPYTVEKSSDFLAEPEILLALSILRIMDNPIDDISLAAALRSPVFGFTANDLYEVKRYYAFEFLYDCVVRCSADYKRFLNAGKRYKANKNFRRVTRRPFPLIIRQTPSGQRPDTVIRKKCYDFTQCLKRLRALAAESPANRLIWDMYMQTSLVSLCAAEENGKKKVQNLYTLYQYALDFEASSFKGLSSFLSYISDIAGSYGSSLGGGEGDKDRVKIMSVHKSKGMEFPVCFVSALGKKFNITDLSDKYIVRDDGYVFYNLRSNGNLTEYIPFIKHAAAFAEKKALYREELRCLYVALTRAKERLFVTGVSQNSKKDYGEEGKGFFESKSYLDWILPILKSTDRLCFDIRHNLPDYYSVKAKVENTGEYAVPDEVFIDAVNFVYPYGSGYRVPAKAAVSELRKGILEDGEYTRTVSKSEATKIPSFAAGRKDFTAIGSATHLFMQFADFANVDKNGVLAEIDRLVGIKMITPEEGSLIDVKAVEEFFTSPLKDEISRSKLVFREKRFNLIEESSLVSGETGEKVMIQGVIDCFFQNPDGTFTVVDYKTDRLPKEGGEDILKNRHSLQIKYYCRAAEKITGSKVTKAYLYSFSLGKAIEVDYEG